MKKIAVLGLLLVLLLSVVPSFSQDQVTLHLMHWTGAMVDKTPWWHELTAGFEAQHPGVTVETNFVAFPQYLPTLQAMIAGGSLPDLFYGHVKVADLGRGGLTVNYKDVLPADFFDGFFPSTLRQLTFDGKVYGLPWTAQMFGFYVNDKIMKDLGLTPPETWDDLLAMTPKIKEAGYVPLAWGNSAKNVCPDFMLPIVAQYGGDVYALDALTDPSVSWDSEPVIKAFTLVQKLAQAGVFVDGINGVSESDGQQIAFQGKAAMLFSLSSVAASMATSAPPEWNDNVSVSKFPALTKDGVHYASDGTGSAWVLNANSPNKDLAVEFVKYMYSDDVYDKATAGLQSLPSRPSALDQVTIPAVKTMADWITTDGADHVLYGLGTADAVYNVCQGVLDNSLTPEAAAKQIQDDIMATRAQAATEVPAS